MPFRMGTDDTRREVFEAAIWDAMKTALRWSTLNGTETWDPDAICQNLVVCLLGYNSPDGLGFEDWHDPARVPPVFDGLPR